MDGDGEYEHGEDEVTKEDYRLEVRKPVRKCIKTDLNFSWRCIGFCDFNTGGVSIFGAWLRNVYDCFGAV